MGLNTDERQNVVYFTGYEVEHTICFGKFTLFVVGTPPVEEILAKAKETGVDHIYFGTSQSFPNISINDAVEWHKWEKVIKACLDAGYWCTLDLDVKQAEGLLESGLCEHQRFVPMISVKLPHITLFNYNTTLKIDDRTWNDTNSGVWTHQLHDLMDKDKYTHWDQYKNDNTVDLIQEL
jgi:hypothetical protein